MPVGAFALLETLVPVLRRGYVLLIDYGSVEGAAGPVHGYRDHREVADVLADPGGADITAGVDVSMVAERARSVGLRAFEPVSQRAALRALGHDRWERTMRTTQSELQQAGRRARGRARLGGAQPREPARRPRGVRRVLVARPRDRGVARAAVAHAGAHPRRAAGGAIGFDDVGPAPAQRAPDRASGRRRRPRRRSMPRIAIEVGDQRARAASRGARETFENDAVRIFSRYGSFLPSPDHVVAHQAERVLGAHVDLALGDELLRQLAGAVVARRQLVHALLDDVAGLASSARPGPTGGRSSRRCGRPERRTRPRRTSRTARPCAGPSARRTPAGPAPSSRSRSPSRGEITPIALGPREDDLVAHDEGLELLELGAHLLRAPRPSASGTRAGRSSFSPPTRA